MLINKDNVLFYHGNCSDGFGAAFSFWKKFGNNMNYVPISHYETFDGVDVSGKNVYFADIAPIHPPSFEKVQEMANVAKSICILDHHKSSYDLYKDKPYFVYDVNKSGAKLAWEFNFPDQKNMLIEYIEDRDIWKWNLPESKFILNVLDTLEMSFEEWNSFSYSITNNVHDIIRIGQAIQNSNEKLIDRVVRDAHVLSIKNYNCIAVNSSLFKSELGMTLSNKYYGEYDFAAIYHISKNNEVVFSLRSKNDLPADKIFDVTQVAQLFGGGGHKTAAGFTISSMSDLK